MITGGTGSTPGTSGAGAAGAKGGDGGIGVDSRKPVTGTLTILNSGQITGGNGAAGSAGTPNGANGLGGVGIQMLCDGTITTSGAISGGLNGDGVTRANAITLLSGVHTLTLQTGATFAGNVVVDTAATSNAGVSASNTLDLDGAGTGTISLPQFQNFGHLTQTSGSGGTWTLTGAGAVTLDTTVSAGTMVLGAGAVLTSPNVNLLTGGTLSLSTAALANDALNINGGTLQVTGIALNSLPNTIAYGANGGTFDIVAAANTFSISQALAGAGSLTKIGAGTLALTGDNTYSGGTTISAGTLQLGNGGTTGSVAGNILNNAILAFNRSNALTFGGVISGTGAVQQNGAGTTILTADNTYTGGTTINAGTLQLGNGGTAGSIVGNVLNNGALAFNRSDAVTFGGVISGTGALQQNGAGSTNLTAANTYTGATTVNAGTLFVNGSIATSSGVTVNAGGTLGGTGALPQATINGGTLSPGNSIGTVIDRRQPLICRRRQLYRRGGAGERRPHQRDRRPRNGVARRHAATRWAPAGATRSARATPCSTRPAGSAARSATSQSPATSAPPGRTSNTTRTMSIWCSIRARSRRSSSAARRTSAPSRARSIPR